MTYGGLRRINVNLCELIQLLVFVIASTFKQTSKQTSSKGDNKVNTVHRSRVIPIAFFFVCTVLFALAGTVAADCCNITQCVTASNACNIFCCNCDGPCSNYGVTCANGPVIVGDVMGNCPGYQNCSSNSYCNPGYTCCNNNTQCCASSGAASTKPLTAVLKRSSDPRQVPTAAQAQVCADRFKSIDTNKNNSISRDEFASWAKKNGLSLANAELTKRFDEMDKNHDGKIEPTEFDSRLK